MFIMSDKNIILKTFQNNNLDIPYQDTSISLDGQDIILQPKSGESLRLPFAAQFVSMSGSEEVPVFELTFSDGFKLDAKEVLSKALVNYKENDGLLSVNKLDKAEEHKHNKNNDNDNTDEAPPAQVIKEKVVVQEIVEKVIEKGGESEVDNDLYAFLNKQYDFEDSAIYKTKPTPVFFSTSSTAQKNKDAEQTEILNKPNDTSSINYPDTLKLLQLETVYNTSKKTVHAGGGSRTDGSFDAQYGTQLIDMSAYNNGMTFDATIRGSSENSTKLTKIIKLGDGYTIKSFSTETNSVYRLVYSNTEEGAKLGLSPDEFAIIYDTDTSGLKFTLPIKAEKDGVEYDYNLGFSIQNISENDNSVIDSAGYVLLNKSPSALVIKGTSGDDLFLAGYGQDVYDGGSGSDTLSYEKHNTGITVDFTNKDEANKILAQNGISSSDSAFVTTGKVQQVITNFNSIIGTSHNDTFIIGDSSISINSGDGDDKFIIKGGSFDINGGGGCNSITFEQINNLGILKDVQITDQMNHQIDGVEINLSAGTVTFNKDGTLQSGVIQNINSVIGSSHNDIIIGSDKDDIIDGAGGLNIIYGSSGNDIIDGGEKGGILSYASMQQSIDVNLTKNEANKGAAGVDKFSNIATVIGAAGGGSLSSDGINATFIGTGGTTKFTIENGAYSLFGGKDQNIYTLKNSVTTVTGKGNDTLTSTDSLLTYAGNASSHSVLDISGGKADITTGTGSSMITAKDGSNIIIHTSHGGEVVYHSIDANALFHLDEKTSTTLDYSETKSSSGISAHLSNGIIQGSSFTDTIVTGNISKLIGSQHGNNTIDASGIKNNISLIGYKSNNTFIAGSGNSNHYEIINPEGSNNILDYSALSELIHVDLSNDIIHKNNQTYDQVINFNHIIGSSASGNSFKGKNGVDTIFDIRQGREQSIFGKDEGNDIYSLTTGNDNTLNYNELKSGIIFTQDAITGQSTVTKNNYTDIIHGQADKVYGTDYDDIFYLNNGIVSKQDLYGGKGNDVFVFDTLTSNILNIDGGEGLNSFVWARKGSGVSTFYLNQSNDNGSFNFQINAEKYTSVNNISKLIFKGDSSAYLRWGKDVKNINILVESHNGNKTFEFQLSGGGNNIDGGSDVSKTSWSKVDYNNLNNGVEADLKSGYVKYLDGSQNDTLKNINSIRGTWYDDTITGSELDTIFLASRGNDKYIGNGKNDEYQTTFKSTLNLENKTIFKDKYGMDSFSNIEHFNLSNSDDVIQFSTNINNITINAGNGTDTLQQLESGDKTIDLKDMNYLNSVEVIDISKVNHDKISFDLDGFFKSHEEQQSLKLVISAADAANKGIFDITHNNTWSLDVSSQNKFVYVDNANHQLTVEVV